MDKIQLNLYIDEDVREMFDTLVKENRMNRPIYFSQWVRREYKKMMMEQTRNQSIVSEAKVE